VTDAGDPQAVTWTSNLTPVNVPVFTEPTGATFPLPAGATEFDFFEMFFTDGLMTEILQKTNRYTSPGNAGYRDLERKFWNNLHGKAVLYRAGVSGTLIDDDQSSWNLNNLQSILDKTNDLHFEGITTPHLYFGSWKSAFAWHTKDMDLYSVNYLHHGAAKAWYGIPPQYGHQFEELASGNILITCILLQSILSIIFLVFIVYYFIIS